MPNIEFTTEDILLVQYERLLGKPIDSLPIEEKNRILETVKKKAKEFDEKSKKIWNSDAPTTKEPTDEELQELWYGYGRYTNNQSNEEKGRSK